ncbi:hypothetical protein M0R45_008830 [Rubus argutus]|uniref:Uncharacterized protein n=1 Tax=Rubus argutus TaxID=59490 RepID=A0AAW1Y4U8_RUBAR
MAGGSVVDLRELWCTGWRPAAAVLEARAVSGVVGDGRRCGGLGWLSGGLMNLRTGQLRHQFGCWKWMHERDGRVRGAAARHWRWPVCDVSLLVAVALISAEEEWRQRRRRDGDCRIGEMGQLAD